MENKSIVIFLIFSILFVGISTVNAENIGNDDLNLFSDNDSVNVENIETETGSFKDLQSEIDNAGEELNLNKNYTYSDEDSTVNINKKITINGNGHSIDALGKIRIMQINSNSVVLNNITFKNGYYAGSPQNSEAHGAAIYCFGNNTQIKNCIFDSNEVAGRYGSGGAIYLEDEHAGVHDVLIDNTIFKNNKATDSGGALWLNGDNVFVSNCAFINNSVIRMLDDYACHDAEGGAIYIGKYEGINRVISNTIFVNNTAYANEKSRTADGGALYIMRNCDILHCRFINNTARDVGESAFGGAVYAYSDINIKDSAFTNNSADYGGAVEFRTGICNFDYSNFTDNRAILGGAFFSEDAEFNIKNCILTHNTASKKGGAFYDEYDHCNIENSVFNGNYANEGGAIYLDYKCSLTVKSSNFINNSAVEGGVICNYYINDLDIEDSNFINNSAESGGAICLSSDCSLTVKTSKFIKNTAQNGGAIYYWSQNIFKIEDTSFDDNSATSQGGAIYLGSYYTKPTENSTLLNCNFTNNSAQYGGAFFTYCGDKRYVIKSNFINNTAKSGGAIYWWNKQFKTTENIIEESYFENNNAKSGGALMWNCPEGKIESSEFVFNKANAGSAVYLISGKLDISDSTFVKNQALSYNITCSDYNETHFNSKFVGWDNIINAIYNNNQKITLTNVSYWGIGGVANTGSTTQKPVMGYANSENGKLVYQDFAESNIKITFEIFDEEGNLVKSLIAYTDGSGVAHADVSGLNPGNYTVKAVHYSDDYYTQITSGSDSFMIHKDGTKIISKRINQTVLNKINITETVLDENNQKVENGTAVLQFNGKNYTAEVHNGTVTFTNVDLVKAGKFTSKVIYKGNDYYDASSGSVDIIVSKIPTHTYDHNITHISPHEIIVVVTVVDDYDKPLKNGTVELIITYEEKSGESLLKASYGSVLKEENKHSYFAKINNGKAVFDIVLPKLGDYLIDAEYYGSDIYYASEDEVETEIEAENTKITIEDVSGKAGERKTITATVIDKDGNPVYDGTATLVIGDKEYNTTVIKGKAIFNDVILPDKNMTGKVYYNGDNNYTKSNATFNITVVEDPESDDTNESQENETFNPPTICPPDTVMSSTYSEPHKEAVKSVANQTGNPIFAILLVMMILLCNVVRRRK